MTEKQRRKAERRETVDTGFDGSELERTGVLKGKNRRSNTQSDQGLKTAQERK